ncbi:MAG: hypothetical protein KBT75_05890 [Oleispira antarctica]|uniref:Uncharacterized protein n=1 Tax=Oleispira antarctica RB-8 TaxID=698738 RepID=R4YN46_OLEAN|nr:hypothetical protein [Oleispira antarctica]MBQ0793465.1 hypothetical protein [Oleispira antarctica]CCK76362.1 hypothetical protein OLEAN_C21860 [Oleispira antarctica RB-8]
MKHRNTSLGMIGLGLIISLLGYFLAKNTESFMSLFGYLSLLSIGIPLTLISLPLFLMNIENNHLLDVMYKEWLPLILVVLSILFPFLYIRFESMAKSDDFFGWIITVWGMVGIPISILMSANVGMLYSWMYRRDA